MAHAQKSRFRPTLKIASALIYVGSLTMPVFFGADIYGFAAWRMLDPEDPAQPVVLAWIAILSNIFYYILLFVRGKKPGLVLSSIMLVMGSMALGLQEIPEKYTDDLGTFLPGFGFFTWNISYLTMFFHFLRKRRVVYIPGEPLQ